MVKRKKQPATPASPHYPTLKIARMDRRSFLTIAGVSSAVLILPSCLPAGAVSGASPDFYSARLPREDGAVHTCQMSDETHIGYFVLAEFDNPDFSGFVNNHNADLLTGIDEILTDAYSFGQLDSDGEIELVEDSIETYLAQSFQAAEGETVEFFALKLEIVE